MVCITGIRLSPIRRDASRSTGTSSTRAPSADSFASSSALHANPDSVISRVAVPVEASPQECHPIHPEEGRHGHGVEPECAANHVPGACLRSLRCRLTASSCRRRAPMRARARRLSGRALSIREDVEVAGGVSLDRDDHRVAGEPRARRRIRAERGAGPLVRAQRTSSRVAGRRTSIRSAVPSPSRRRRRSGGCPGGRGRASLEVARSRGRFSSSLKAGTTSSRGVPFQRNRHWYLSRARQIATCGLDLHRSSPSCPPGRCRLGTARGRHSNRPERGNPRGGRRYPSAGLGLRRSRSAGSGAASTPSGSGADGRAAGSHSRPPARARYRVARTRRIR